MQIILSVVCKGCGKNVTLSNNYGYVGWLPDECLCGYKSDEEDYFKMVINLAHMIELLKKEG